ncbi:long-chain fatty acid--CoA ligase [bacterium]|nr:long-chain fatty acid--CoA ligase [bacterium]
MVLRDHAGDMEWTYSQFNARAAALAHWLTGELGIRKGDRVVVFAKNRAETVLLYAACVKTGIILVPLNFRLMPRELDGLLKDAEPAAFFFEDEFADLVEQIPSLNSVSNRHSYSTLEPFLLNDPGEVNETIPAEPISEDDVVMILYTAGSTGVPKGAMITHRMLFWNSINTGLRLDLTSGDHTQSFAPFFHTGGWNVLLTPFLHHGGSHTLLEKFDPALILKLMEQERTTLLFGVPTMLQMMAECPEFDEVDLSSVRYAVVGGAPMPEPLINRWHDKGIFIRQGYGLTEVGPNCFSLHQDDAIRKRGSIGFPNYYIDAKIAGADGNDVGVNTPGELWLRSPVVTPGYWRRPDATAEAITGGWFHTGDVVQRDDEGFVYVVDRKKNMFISGGENVYPADVERFLYTHPAVREVAVIGVKDDKWGEVGKAYVSLNPDTTLKPEELIQFCKGQLAGYKTPKHVVFLDDLPKNDAGKINRLALQKDHESGT